MAQMKLTKTQQKLLESARNNGGRGCVILAAGSGAQGGKISSGWRDSEALRGLVAAGMVEIVSRNISRDINRGFTVTIHTTSFKLC